MGLCGIEGGYVFPAVYDSRNLTNQGTGGHRPPLQVKETAVAGDGDATKGGAWRRSGTEEVTVGSRSFKVEHVFVDAVEEQPIRFDVAVAGADPGTGQGVITVLGFEGLSLDDPENDIFEFSEILAAFLQAFDVLAELGGLMNRSHWSQLPKRSFVLRWVVRPRPVRESSSACRVVALGISTGKGNPLRRAIWV
jgi:hypothetical protein